MNNSFLVKRLSFNLPWLISGWIFILSWQNLAQLFKPPRMSAALGFRWWRMFHSGCRTSSWSEVLWLVMLTPESQHLLIWQLILHHVSHFHLFYLSSDTIVCVNCFSTARTLWKPAKPTEWVGSSDIKCCFFTENTELWELHQIIDLRRCNWQGKLSIERQATYSYYLQ